jgi:hypothetical protein
MHITRSDIHTLKLEEYTKASDYFDKVTKVLSASADANDKKLYADAALRGGGLRDYGQELQCRRIRL